MVEQNKIVHIHFAIGADKGQMRPLVSSEVECMGLT